MDKKAQAAMEFLMTYGWAILAAIIAIGVLAYFGVFSPGKLVGNAATLSPPFAVDEFNIDDNGATDAINIVISQNLGENVDIQGAVTLTLPDGTTTCTATPATATLQSGQPLPLALSCGLVSVFGADEAVRGNLLVVYRKTSGGTLDQRSTGTLRGTAQ